MSPMPRFICSKFQEALAAVGRVVHSCKRLFRAMPGQSLLSLDAATVKELSKEGPYACSATL